MSRPVWLLFVMTIISSPFLFQFDLIVVGNLQPKILKDLGMVEKLPWISVSYALAAMGTTLLWGRLYTLFNIKWTFLASLLLFNAGSAASGAASSVNILIGGRVLNGVGAVGMYTGALNTLSTVTTPQQRPLYISLITLAVGLGAILAPVVGGALADSKATWRWGFYINLCVSGLFAPGYIFLFPSKCFCPPSVTTMQRLRRLDSVGNLIWAGASTTLLMAISFGGAVYSWSSGQIIALFVVSVVLWIAFCIQQLKALGTTKESRIFLVKFLSSLELCILFVQVGVSTAIANLPVFLIPIYFQLVRSSNALTAGLHLLPLLVCRSVFILTNGLSMRKWGYVVPWYLCGSILCLAGSVLFLVSTPSTSSASIYGFTALIGCGVGMYNQASFAVAQARVSPQLVPQAVAFITTGQIVGSALSLAVATSIFINRATSLITHAIPNLSPGEIQNALLSGTSASLASQTDTAMRSTALRAISKALNDSWASVVAACVVSVVLTAFMKRDRLYKPGT